MRHVAAQVRAAERRVMNAGVGAGMISHLKPVGFRMTPHEQLEPLAGARLAVGET